MRGVTGSFGQSETITKPDEDKYIAKNNDQYAYGSRSSFVIFRLGKSFINDVLSTFRYVIIIVF